MEFALETKVDVTLKQIDKDCNVKESSPEPAAPSPIIKSGGDSDKMQTSKGFSCTLCSQSFKTLPGLISHSKSHGRVRYTCEQCGKVFTEQQRMASHKRAQHAAPRIPRVTYPCLRCAKVFTNKQRLASHSRGQHTATRTPRITYPCQHCGKVCKNEERLASHIRTQHAASAPQTSIVKLSCQHCGKICKNEELLVSHIRTQHAKTPSKSVTTQIQSNTERGVSRRKFRAKSSCNFCGKLFPSKAHLREHMVVHTKEKPHQCPKCKTSFSWKHQLVKHSKTHTDNDIKCQNCELYFPTRKLLESHIETYHGCQELPTVASSYSCEVCASVFPTNESLLHHSQTHKPPQMPEMNKCPYCDKQFDYKSGLQSHLITHSKEKPFQCPKCSELFSWKHGLVRHLKNTHMDKGIQCRKCPLLFPSRKALKTHAQTHVTRERPFQCPTCQMTYTRKDVLTSHIKKKHSQVKNYQCPDCALTFSFNMQLKQHHTEIHLNQRVSGADLHVCGVCSKVFPTISRLIRHSITHVNTNPELRPEKPASTKSSQPDLLRDLRIRSNLGIANIPVHTCQCCGMIFSSKSLLEIHLPIHTEKKESLRCPTCDKTFETQRRLSRHCSETRCRTNEKVFNCLSCDLQFANETSLKFHLCSVKTEEQKFECTECNERVEFSQIGQHMDTHKPTLTTDASTYECEICGNQMSSAKGLEIHYKRHYVEREHKCEQIGCPASYVSKYELRRHQKNIHAAIKEHICKTCQKGYAEIYELRRHERKHREVKPFKSELIAHPSRIRTRAPVKELNCPNCDTTFDSESELRIHMNLHEFNDRQDLPKQQLPIQAHTKPNVEHQCKTCNKQFKSNEVLTAHELMHDIPVKVFRCDLCTKSFTRKSNLKNHRKSHLESEVNEHQHKCKTCAKILKTKRLLRVHQFVHMEQSY